MDHLYVVTRSRLSNPVTAWLSQCLGSGLLEDLLDMWPCSSRSTGHNRGSVSSTLFSSRNTGSDEQEALCLELFGAADGVRIVGVTSVNDDIALLHERNELIDECVDGRSSLDEEDDLARRLELFAELLDRMCALDVGAYGILNENICDLILDNTYPWPRSQGNSQPCWLCGCRQRH